MAVTGVRPNQSEAIGANPTGVVMERTVPLADCGTVEIHRCGFEKDKLVLGWVARNAQTFTPTSHTAKVGEV